MTPRDNSNRACKRVALRPEWKRNAFTFKWRSAATGGGKSRRGGPLMLVLVLA